MTSNLDNLAGPTGPLRKEAFDATEFAGLVRSADVRLTDAQNLDERLVADLITACKIVAKAIAGLPKLPDK